MRVVMVAPAMQAPVAIGLDVGGTKILSGLVDRDGSILAEHEVPSPDGSEEGVLAALDEAVVSLLDERVAAIGYGIPANLERGTGRILRAMNLPLDDVDLAARSRERFGLPVGVENDASAATLAEWRRGAGRGTQNLVMLTLGTGVGGGVVIGGGRPRAGGTGPHRTVAWRRDRVARERPRPRARRRRRRLRRCGRRPRSRARSRGGARRCDLPGQRRPANRRRRAGLRRRPRRSGPRRLRGTRRSALMPLAICATPIGNLDD